MFMLNTALLSLILTVAFQSAALRKYVSERLSPRFMPGGALGAY